MKISEMPHITVEQVLALRKAAIEIEKELAELKAMRGSSTPCPKGVCEFNAYNKHVSALRRENAELIKHQSGWVSVDGLDNLPQIGEPVLMHVPLKGFKGNQIVASIREDGVLEIYGW